MSNAHEKKPKSGTIDTFKSHFDDGARSNRFHVNFYCPPLGLTLEGWRVESVSFAKADNYRQTNTQPTHYNNSLTI